MPSVSVSERLDLEQGLHFQPDQTKPVGYLISLDLGGTVLTADITVVDPTDRAPTKVVGVIDEVEWGGKVGGPISLSANISAENRQLVSALRSPAMPNTSLVLNFRTYGYDQATKQYFVSFGPSMPPLPGSIATHDGEPAIDIGEEPAGQPATSALSLVIAPPVGEQILLIARAPDARVTQTWGWPEPAPAPAPAKA